MDAAAAFSSSSSTGKKSIRYPFRSKTFGGGSSTGLKSAMRRSSLVLHHGRKVSFVGIPSSPAIEETISPFHQAYGKVDSIPACVGAINLSPAYSLRRSLITKTTVNYSDSAYPSGTRYLKIGRVPVAYHAANMYKKLHNLGSMQHFSVDPTPICNTYAVSYYHIEHSIRAFMELESECDWTVQFCSTTHFGLLCTDTTKGGSLDKMSSDADVICDLASYKDESSVTPLLYKSLSEFGPIVGFTNVGREKPLPRFLITFEHACHAVDFANYLDGQYMEGWHLQLKAFPLNRLQETSSTWEAISCRASNHTPLGRVDGNWARLGGSQINAAQRIWYSQPVGPVVNEEPFPDCSKMVSNSTPNQENAWSSSIPQPFPDQYAFQSSGGSLGREGSIQSSRKNSGHSAGGKSRRGGGGPGKNVVDCEAIEKGLDTRTTVMLRNIPNKVDQETLKQYVDETSRGRYNFLYLRIDFHNVCKQDPLGSSLARLKLANRMCSVGYAFINFVDSQHIIEFVRAKAGTRWNKFNSEKVLDVTYANVQGIDQLVEKFRNSSVMDQDPAFRPKLYETTGETIGNEVVFPAPNNLVKKSRSTAAAQQIGLFAPKTPSTGKGVWRKRDQL